jgi:hypothetical protein
MSLKPLQYKTHHVVIDASRINRRRYESNGRYFSQVRGNPAKLPTHNRNQIVGPPFIQGFNREKEEESQFNHSNGASSSTNNSPRSQSPIDAATKIETGKETKKTTINLPILHNTCCNFFNPSLVLHKQSIVYNAKANLKVYLAKMPTKIEATDRKTYTSKGTRQKPAIEKKKSEIPDIKTMTSVNFYQERPESRRNGHAACENFERPVTSKKPTLINNKVAGKEDSMFCIDEELLSDD